MICQDISPNQLQQIDIPDGNSHYSSTKHHFVPISTNTFNYSIDFLPDHEYQLFRVVKTIDVIDPQHVLPQTPEQSYVLIFQGSQSENPSYTSGSQTEMPIPKDEVHTFPIIYDSSNLPIIFNHHGYVEPYTSTTIQTLFKTQACIPMNPNYEANQWACPHNPSQLWRQSNPIHHVIDDPNTIPLDIAIRLIQVITTKRGSDSVYRAWALPHLKDALQKPTVQISHNCFSFFWQQHNHPEYPYTNKTPEILLNIFPGESSTECARIENETKSINCNSHIPPGHRHNDVNVATEDNCNVIRYELDKQQNPCNHNALAVLTHRSSLLPENNPGIEPETPIYDNPDSHAENDEIGHETAEISENSPISATPALFVDTSQQILTAHLNPLQRFSRAVEQILTPKTPSSDMQEQFLPPATENNPKTQTPTTNAPPTKNLPSEPKTRQERHPTFAYPPIHETFFDNNDDDVGPPLASPDALTSSPEQT